MRLMLGLTAFGFLCATAAAHPGVGIVMDSRGNVFYTDLSHVWKIAPGGAKSIAVWGVHTHELYLDREDNLYGEHLWYEGDRTKKWGHRVWKLTADGKLSDVIPAREGFLQDYSFVRDGRGNMYWAERGAQTMLRKRTPAGRIETLGPVDIFRDIRWMTCTTEGTVYLIDGQDLRRVASDGTVDTVARDLGERKLSQFQAGDRHILMGLWTDRAQNVFVAVYGARLVKKIDRDGKVTIAARSQVPWSPTGGLAVPNGDLWLLEYSITNAARARHIQRDGKENIY